MLLHGTDIKLVRLSTHRAGGNLTTGWRRGIVFLNGVRRWTFLPALVMAVLSLVVFDGADAKSVCLNTVAVLFMLEYVLLDLSSLFDFSLPSMLLASSSLHSDVLVVRMTKVLNASFLTTVSNVLDVCHRFDNTAYAFGVPERWRTRMEETGKVELTPTQSAFLAQTKFVHICFLAIAGPAMVVFCRVLPPAYGFPVGIFVTCLTFMVGGIVEGADRVEEESDATSSNSILVHGCKTFRAWVLGLIGVVIFYSRAANN